MIKLQRAITTYEDVEVTFKHFLCQGLNEVRHYDDKAGLEVLDLYCPSGEEGFNQRFASIPVAKMDAVEVEWLSHAYRIDVRGSEDHKKAVDILVKYEDNLVEQSWPIIR